MTDKTQQKVIDFMIEKSYSHIIRRVIVIYVFKDIDQIRSTFKVEGLPTSMSGWDKFKVKQQMIKDTLQTDKCKNTLIGGLTITSKMKDDIIKEILEQYGIDKTDDSTNYHDQMCAIFDRHVGTIKACIHVGDYMALEKMLDVGKEGT